MSDILDQLRRVAYVMFKDGWQSKETAGLAFLEITSLRAEITRLQKELETAREEAADNLRWRTDDLRAELAQAREDALEEAAQHFASDGAYGAWHSQRVASELRRLKDKEAAG